MCPGNCRIISASWGQSILSGCTVQVISDCRGDSGCLSCAFLGQHDDATFHSKNVVQGADVGILAVMGESLTDC